MPEIIHVLSERVANQIAAGEVVQRPASALKELIENSLDAGADEILILSKEGGKTLIQVNDNGMGMIPKDAVRSFSRHATSKIIESDDLFRIRTMGFRGEALASIAAVSQVKMRSRHHEEEMGTLIRIEGSRLIEQIEDACPIGTSVEIRNLFYNIPARRSFLKSDFRELKHLITEIERISLSYPQVFFSFFHDGKEVLHLPKGSHLQRIMHLFGNSYAEKIVPVEESTDLLTINGYIGKPEFSKKGRNEQYFHLNGRFIRDPYLHHSLMTAYQDWIPLGQFPFYSLHLGVDPSKIDINVHPGKTEIKFVDEKIMYTLVQSAVKRSLGKFHLAPQIDFNAETGFSEMSVLSRNNPISIPKSYVNQNYNPFATKLESNHSTNFLVDFGSNEIEANNQIKDNELFDRETKFLEAREDLQIILQVQKEFVVTSLHSGLILIDQQAAHERILFERYLKTFSDQLTVIQQTLFPQSFTFSLQDTALLNSLLPDIRKLGFEIREFGSNSFILEGIPSDFSFTSSGPFLDDILSNFKENREIGNRSQQENLARSLSKKASIKAGKALNKDEMRLLIDELFACEYPSLSPRNKPTYITLSLNDIKKRFKE